MQISNIKEPTVSRNLVTSLHKYHITYHHITSRNLEDFALSTSLPPSNYLYRLFLTHLRQHVKLAGSVTLEVETYSSGKDDSSNDAYRLNIILLNKCQYHRHQGGYQ